MSPRAGISLRFAAALGLAGFAAGCGANEDPLQIRYDLSAGPAQSCPSTECSDVAISCDAVLQIRIVDPDAPTVAYVSECLPIDDPTSLCAIAGGDLPAGLMIPTERVEVQIAVYPRDAVGETADGELICPTDLRFGGDGLPILVEPTPAVAGRAFAEPGDDQIVVELGCTDLSLLRDDACRPIDVTQVSASIDDFDTRVFVAPSVAESLVVSVGEPLPRINPNTQEIEFVLSASQAAVLPQTVAEPVPGWSAEVDRAFTDTACVQVLEDAPQATTSITCRNVEAGQPAIDLRGFRVTGATVNQVLGALDLDAFPAAGMVIGLVVDHLGNPAPEVSVTPSTGAVAYLDSARTAIVLGDSTSAAGMFVSLDVPFDVTWQVVSSAPVLAASIGGLVVGKLTVVVIELDNPLPG